VNVLLILAVLLLLIIRADLHVAPAFLFTVASGSERGKTWLVDPLLDPEAVRKFSGTTQAGSNTGLVGQTCDAFAHFSLHDSDQHLVFVDIQGLSNSC